MRKLVSRGIIMFAGLLATPVLPHSLDNAQVKDFKNDPRFALLKRFFEERRAPAKDHVGDFILAADQNKLDWRLLPSISVVESGGGKEYKNNNILGWGSCEEKFPSVKAGIHAVAKRLSTSKLYKNKGVEGILHTYNSNADYPSRVKKLMHAISPRLSPAVLLQD
ncbi:MAG: hypothetical protein ABI822_18080 [Bryobacteraceae bacterium]